MRGWTEHRGRGASAGLDDRPGSLPAPPAEATAPGGWRWLPPLVLLYGASRLAAGVILFAVRRPGHPFASAWDAAWYLEVARRGYPASLAAAPGADLQRLAFFPMLPLLLRLTGARSGPAALTVALLVGFAATCLVWLLTRTLMGERDGDAAAAHAAAGRAAALFCFFPGALVLSIPYAEGLAVALAAACLLGLVKRNWILAGAAAGLATATRPNALAVVAACAWAAAGPVRRHQWRALLAPALAPLGIAAFALYLWHRTGAWDAWFRVQNAYWAHSVDLSKNLLLRLRPHQLALAVRLRDWDHLAADFGFLVAVAGLVAMARWRPPAPVAVYTLGVLAFSAVSSDVGFRPRFVLLAFPVLCALAVRPRGAGYHALLGLFVALLGLVAYLSLGGAGLTP